MQQDAEILTATSAEAALRMMAEQTPQLLLLDQHLEGDITGLALWAQIRAHSQWQTIPAILMSATDTPEIRRQASAAGVAMSLAKPIDPIQGIALIRRYLQQG